MWQQDKISISFPKFILYLMTRIPISITNVNTEQYHKEHHKVRGKENETGFKSVWPSVELSLLVSDSKWHANDDSSRVSCLATHLPLAVSAKIEIISKMGQSENWIKRVMFDHQWEPGRTKWNQRMEPRDETKGAATISYNNMSLNISSNYVFFPRNITYQISLLNT